MHRPHTDQEYSARELTSAALEDVDRMKKQLNERPITRIEKYVWADRLKQRLLASFLLTTGLSLLYLGIFNKQLDELWKLVKVVSETCIAGIP